MPQRIANPQKKQTRLLTDLAIKRAEKEAAEKAYNDKKAEFDALLQPLLDAKTAATEAEKEVEDKIKSDFANAKKDDLIPGIKTILRKTWQYNPVEVLRWAILFYPSVLCIDKNKLKHELNDAADNKSKATRIFEELGIPAQETKVPEIQIEWSKLDQYLPPVDVDAEPEAQPIPLEETAPKAPAEIAEQINAEDEIPAIFAQESSEAE